jgi:tetratricopeptide (TPR) repeat protein
MRRSRSAAVLTAVIAAVALAAALTIPLPSRGTEADADQQQLLRARQMEKTGRMEEALEIYRELLGRKPGDRELLSRIRGVYRGLKWYPRLIEMILEQLRADPGDFELRVELGEAHFLAGDVDRARETWLEALTAAPRQESSFFRISDAFLERGMLAEAESILLRGRQALEDGTLFADRLARIHELRADYGAAAEEYLIWVRQDLRRINYVDTQLARFPDQPEVEGAVEDALRRGVDRAAAGKTSDEEALRQLLSRHLIRTGQPQEAYGEIRALEGSSDAGGQLLISFAGRCAELGYHDAAIQAGRDVLERYPETPAARQAYLVIGRSLETLERYGPALLAYHDLLDGHPGSSEAVEALYRQGEVYRQFGHLLTGASLSGEGTGDGASADVLFIRAAIDSAQAAYQRLIDRYGRSARAADAAMRIGDCLVIKGDAEGARAAYSRLAHGRGPEQIREEAAFKLAELLFLEGRIDETREALDGLVESYPQGLTVNDALMLSMLIMEASDGPQEALRSFAEAAFLDRQRRYQAALEAFRLLEGRFPDSPLQDDVRMRTALIRERLGRHQEALTDLQALIDRYPQSRLCAPALRRIGEIYQHKMKDLPAARQAYERLLTDYPEYLFLNEVRRTLRALSRPKAG